MDMELAMTENSMATGDNVPPSQSTFHGIGGNITENYQKNKIREQRLVEENIRRAQNGISQNVIN